MSTGSTTPVDSDERRSGLRARLHLSEHRESQVVRLLQFAMVGILSIGLWLGNLGVVVNAAVGLFVTQLPVILHRRWDLTLGVGLVLWITTAMFLHALGTLPFPGSELLTPYQSLWWWDHMTHALSSSLVAGVAYATARAVDEYTDAVHLPPRFLIPYLLIFVMAFGVVWELIEFLTAEAAAFLGTGAVLTQYGLDDTVLDLVYNSLGGLAVALLGAAHLTGISDQLADRFDDYFADREP